jgi:hypothetical protein
LREREREREREIDDNIAEIKCVIPAAGLFRAHLARPTSGDGGKDEHRELDIPDPAKRSGSTPPIPRL